MVACLTGSDVFTGLLEPWLLRDHLWAPEICSAASHPHPHPHPQILPLAFAFTLHGTHVCEPFHEFPKAPGCDEGPPPPSPASV